MNWKYIKGILFVTIGASSFGVLTTFVKLAYNQGYSTAEVTFAETFLGFLGLIILDRFTKKRHLKSNSSQNLVKKNSKKDKILLILCGTSFGLTSTFYYLAVHYKIPVSICIVLLMQSIWMGAIVEFIINRKKPSLIELLAIITTLIGTVLATNLLNESEFNLNTWGIIFGLLAAVSYTFSIFSSNKIGLNIPSSSRSVYLFLGATLMICLIWGYKLIVEPFRISIFYTWGIVLAFFAAILPPTLYTRGMPIVGIGVGTIIASIELPVSVLMAKFVLNESVNSIQWYGVALIIISIILMNLSFILPNKTIKKDI